MLGFTPSSQNKKKTRPNNKRDHLQGYNVGGVIQGPGTGTSDDIKTEMPSGTYIMPADSTEHIGPQALSQLGQPADVRVSNGEYEMPPEQVHALGVQVLDQLKDETHTAQARGFNPDVGRNGEQFFNQGGTVLDPEELRRRAASANRTALQAPNADPQNNAFNTHGRGDYTAADQTRARARADGASWEAERAKQEARFKSASPAQPQTKPSYTSRGVGRARDVLNKGGRSVPLLTLADTAVTGFQTPTEKYRERFALETDDPSFWGDVGVRTLGLASDLGNTLTFGQAGRLYRDKQREAAEGGNPYMEKVPQAAAVAGTYGGSKAGNATGKFIDKGLQLLTSVATRGKKNYKGNYAEKALGFGGGAAVGTGSYKAADALINAPDNPATQEPVSAPQEQSQQQVVSQQAPAASSAPTDKVEPTVVEGVPTFTNEHAAKIDPSRINTMPSSAMTAPSGQSSEALSAALRDAAARGDWGAVKSHYNSQGKPFGNTGFDSERSRGTQVNVVRDTSRAPSNAEILHQRMAAGQQNRDLEERRLGFDTQQAQARHGLLERNQSLQEALSMPQLRASQQIEGLYQMLEQAETDQERSTIAEQISQLQSGSRSQKDNYITLGGGQVWDEQAQSMVNQPQQLFDIRNQQIVSAGNQLPPLAQNPKAQTIIADRKKSREQKALELRQMGYSIDLSKIQ